MLKRYLFFLILILGGLISSVQGQPIMPYKETGYTIEEVQNFALSRTELSCNWRREFLKIINEGLRVSGESMILTEDNISWIMEHMVYERRTLDNFMNSRRTSSGEIKFFFDRSFDGMVGIFSFNRCLLVSYKTRCMNLLKVQQSPIIEKEQCSPIIKSVVCEDRPVRHSLEEWQPIQEKQITYQPVVKEKVKKHGICLTFGNVTLSLVGLGGIGFGLYSIFHKEPKTVVIINNNIRTPDNGTPGGAPITPDDGGPGGAPTTP